MGTHRAKFREEQDVRADLTASQFVSFLNRYYKHVINESEKF